ncbi:ArnT family glycosyltransferase, partial [Xanthovirga aplysinae]|uniref:ArnT family glycosyltransferase n=1 Tax=Xanthovirga aplysinae TaxID=2529853 RepID=UPI0012BBA2A8
MRLNKGSFPDNVYKLSLLFLSVLHLSGLFTPIIEGDPSLYACISKTMHLTGNYIELFSNGNDWLDKPHLPFWLTALSFKVFGVNDFAYKIPALLFTVLAAFYTYKFARALYNKQVARLAVLSLLAACHLVINNNHVKAEPFLTGFIIASVYYLYKLQHNLNLKNLLLGAMFASFAVMTKGIFVLLPIWSAIGGELLFKRKWKDLFHFKWLLFLLLTLLFITPEVYALYYQFDTHPEKVVFGETGVSGIKFFLWDSQFGRFFNTGPITFGRQFGYFFFLHTLFWAFFPWCVILYYSVLKTILKREFIKPPRGQEFYNISAALFITVLFSISTFKYPHYIVIAFPFYSILIAQSIYKLSSSQEILFFRITQYITIAVGLGLTLLIHYLYREYQNPYYPIIFGSVAICIIGLIIAVSRFDLPATIKIFYQSCL